VSAEAKAVRVCTAAESHGWTFAVSRGDEGTSVSLSRGPELMVITWDKGGSLMHPLTYSISGIKDVRLRNVSAAIKQMADKPNLTAVRTRRPSAPSATAEEGVVEITQEELPFPMDAPDAEIIKALRGKHLVWWNKLGEQYETGQIPGPARVQIPDGRGGKKWVLRTSRNIYVTTSSAGRRIITFPAVNEQFRSVGLDSIVRVQ
jgi:hypothetical protein